MTKSYVDLSKHDELIEWVIAALKNLGVKTERSLPKKRRGKVMKYGRPDLFATVTIEKVVPIEVVMDGADPTGAFGQISRNIKLFGDCWVVAEPQVARKLEKFLELEPNFKLINARTLVESLMEVLNHYS
jgi:hypothetical protein